MRGLIKGLAFSTAMATASFASAADHQYFVTSVNEDQAVLMDLATRSKVGEVVTLDLIILQRQPSTATGSPTYWVDGMQEVDCANHRTRVMLIAAYSLDRSRKASSPNAAFRPWVGNTAADTQAIEAFVCRNVRNAGIRPVADLTTFQKQYFSGEAGLADRGERAIDDARRAVDDLRTAGALPSAPTSAPPTPRAVAKTLPRFVVTGYDKKGLEITDRSQNRRNGAVVTTLGYQFALKPIHIGGMDSYWTEIVTEFDCARHRHRIKLTAFLSQDRKDRRASPDDTPFEKWEADTGSLDAADEDLACNGKMDNVMTGADDLDLVQRSFMAYTKTPERVFTIAQGGPPRAPTQAAPPAPATSAAPAAKSVEQDLILVEQSSKTAMIVNRATRSRRGAVASVAAIVLERAPHTIGALTFYWTEADLEIDCDAHRLRTKITYSHTLDMDHQEPVASAKFDAWEPVPPGSNALETFACTGVVAAGFRPVSDLPAFGRAFIASGPTAPATPPPAPAPTRPAASQAKAKEYRMASVGGNGALLIDRASIRRQGDVVTFEELDMLAKASRVYGGDYWWSAMTEEVDCRLHRNRVRVDSFLSMDRKRSAVEGPPKFSTWSPAGKGTLASMIEDFVCLGKGGGDFDPVPDLDKFQTEVRGAIKAGVFKD